MRKALGARLGFSQSDDPAYQSLNGPAFFPVETTDCEVWIHDEEGKTEQLLSDEEKSRHGGGIVYLKDLYSNLVGDNRALIESLVARADQGLRQALEASLDTLRAVYEVQAPGWDELKQRVEVSFVKKTSNTNTSLTSGIATRLLSPGRSVGILNCGTGFFKFQFYQMDRSNVVRYLHDATPVQLSLSSLAVPPLYMPKVPLSSQAISGALRTQLAPLKEKFRTQVRAVITGPLRACWEAAKDNRKQFEEAVAQVFKPLGVLPWNDQSYFVTQDEEGTLEHLATSNLVRDLEPEYDLMISFGIGKGGCQWATPLKTIKHGAGMGEIEKLLGPNGLKNNVLASFSTPAYLNHLLDFAQHFARPVIALKSGCLLWLERDPYLLELLVQSPARPPRDYGPIFGRDQSLLVLQGNSMVALRVLGFENHRHTMALPFMDNQQQPLSLDLRSTRFIEAPSLELDPTLRRWSEILQGWGFSNYGLIAVNEFRKQHHARGIGSGGFLVPKASRIERAVRRGVQVETYSQQTGEAVREMGLRDSSGTLIGKAKWNEPESSFANMTIDFFPTFQSGYLRNCEFEFCSRVPIQVELTSVPCLELGTRLNMQVGAPLPEVGKGKLTGPNYVRKYPKDLKFLPQEAKNGIYTLEVVDSEGIYHWRIENSTTLVEGWPKGIPSLATRFSYQIGVKLIVLRGTEWVSASVCGFVKTQHQVKLEGTGEKVQMDLNDFNHTWREVLVDDSGGYDVCMTNYKAFVEQGNSMIEDAITGKKLRAADELLAIHIRKENQKDDKSKHRRRAAEEEVNDEEAVDNAPLKLKDYESDEKAVDATLELKDSEPFDVSDMKNVHGLVHILLRECQNQNRHIGCYRVPAFIIVAAPGSGKTWTMRQLVYLLSRAPTPIGTIAQAPFVMFVQMLASLIRRHDPQRRECELDFVEFYIRHTVTKPSQRQFLLQAFRLRTVIVIVDGIDEASDLREVIVNLILRQLYDRGHTFVATSRPEGVQRDDGSLVNSELEKFTILDLAPLTKRQQQRAIKTQLVGNEFYDNLDGFSEVRFGHDKKYSTLTSQWEVEKLASVDKTKQADGKLDPSVRQRGANGELLQTRALRAPLLSLKLQVEKDSKLLDELLAKLHKQQQEKDQKEQTEDKKQILLPPHRRHPAQSQDLILTRSSLWELVVAASDELYSIAERVHPKLEAELRKMCHDAQIECKLEVAPLKDPIRVFEKALDDYWDRFQDDVPATACVTDIIRCRFVCSTLKAVSAVSQLLIENPPPWLELVRAKNKFRELDCAHFRNILFNFRVLCCAGCGALAKDCQADACECVAPCHTSHLFEIQVHHEEILDLSEELHAHVFYDFFRAKSKSIKTEDLDFMIDNQMQFFAEIRSSPVLLSLLILLLDMPDVRLPSSVYELYEMAINASITRFVAQLDEDAERLKKEVLRVVQKIAYRNHMDKKRVFGHLPPTDPDYGLWNEICATGGANGTTVLSFVKVIAQLELYQFSHLSFQEYLFWGEAIETRQSLDFHAMVKDVWNHNALRIGVSSSVVNSMLVPSNEPFVWPHIQEQNVDMCYQLLKNNKGAKEISLLNSDLVVLPRINKQVETLEMTGNRVNFESPLSSGLVDCKLRTLDLTAGITSGLPHLVEALRGNSNLKYLYLAGNDVADDAVPASLFASNPSLVAMTFPLGSLTNTLEFVKAVQRPKTGPTVLVMLPDIVPLELLEGMKREAGLQMWGFNDDEAVLSVDQARMNQSLANHVQALPLSAHVMCVAPVGVWADGPVTFVSLSFAESDLAMIRLTPGGTHLDLRRLMFDVKSLPQLMLYMRNFQTIKLTLTGFFGLECLISMLSFADFSRKVKIHVEVRSTSQENPGLFGFENHRLMRAAKVWGVIIKDKEFDEDGFLVFFLLLLFAFLSVSFWISLAGHFVLSKYQCLVDADNESREQNLWGTRPLNLWNLLTFSWIIWLAGLLDLDFDITSRIAILCSYVGLVLVVLSHNLIGRSEIIPPERRALSASSFTWFEFWSYLVHVMIMCQLMLLMLLDFEMQQTIFTVAMLDIAPVSSQVATLWLWGSVAGTAVALGAVPVVFPRHLGVITLPEWFSLVCGVFEIPIMFHLLGHCFRTILDPAWAGAYASIALCVLALFMLADSSVWLYFKRVYSGRNALDPGEWYMKLDLMLKLIVVFLFNVLAEWPQIFLGLAAALFFVELVIVLKVKPCMQMRGNYFHMGCLAVLVWSALYSLLGSIDNVSPVMPIVALGGGSALIFLVTLSLMVCVKQQSLSVSMLAEIEPLPEWDGYTDNEVVSFILLFVLQEVLTPLIANLIHSWSVEDVCFPLQLWSVLVLVTAVASFLFIGFFGNDWSETQQIVYLCMFACAWFISGVVLFVPNNCGGEVFAFSVYVMVMVSSQTLLLSVVLIREACAR